MTLPAADGPSLPAERRKLPARVLFKQAFRMVREHPRESMLPLFVIQAPVAVIAGAFTAILYFTAFSDEAYASAKGAPLLALLLMAAFEGLFAQVARAGTIVSVAAVARGRPKSLSESLDPAFTRMGPLIVLVAILAAGFGLGILSVIGLVVLPYLVLRLAISFETFILEELGPWAAVRRSWTLMTGNLMRLLGLVTLNLFATIGPLAAIQALALISGSTRTQEVLLGSVIGAVQGILLIPVIAFLTASTTLFYLNLMEPPSD